MRIIGGLVAAALAAAVLGAAPAAAQNRESWVSGVGDDLNPCTRAAPCRTIGGSLGALIKTSPGGQINCLDAVPIFEGTITINKSITIDCDQGTIVASGGASLGLLIQTSGTVYIRGLQIDGGLASTGGGIAVAGGGELFLDHVTIRNFLGDGLFWTGTGTRRIYITDSTIANNRNSSAGGGILVEPRSGSGSIVVTRSQIIGNTSAGIRVKASTSAAGSTTVKLRDSTISGNGNGIIVTAPAGGGSASVAVQDSEVARNGTYGLVANGPLGQIVVGNSVVTGNAAGVFAADGAAMVSAGNNGVNGNGYDGAFTSSVAPQ